MEAHSRTKKLADSPPLFQHGFIHFFSRVHPAIPAIIFIPVIVAVEWIGATKGWEAWQMVAISLGGLAFWTLTEYWLHRLIFHWEPDNAFGRRMHFIIHGVHHDHPNDKMRLVMPPSVSIPLAALFFLGFLLLLRHPPLPPLRRLHARLPRLRLHALLPAPRRPEDPPRQETPRAAHAPPLSGS